MVSVDKNLLNTKNIFTLFFFIVGNPSETLMKTKRIQRKRTKASEGETKANVSYSIFIKVLLDFQLNAHEKYLSRFVKIFKQFNSKGYDIVIICLFFSLKLLFNYLYLIV